MIKDGYDEFFEYFKISKEDFVSYGIKNLLLCNVDKAYAEWKDLKLRIATNQDVYIRGYGRNASSTNLFFKLYQHLLSNENIRKDPTNNAVPSKLIQEWTGFSKLKSAKNNHIQNYQVSHIFGMTKNPYLFAAPFNIFFIPKIFDPFTGHEAKGDIVDLFTEKIRGLALQKFEPIIEEYNGIVTNKIFIEKREEALSKVLITAENNKCFEKFKKDVIAELSEIRLKKVA